jgi:CubicO group peptidase (beta-lactamase class C family)
MPDPASVLRKPGMRCVWVAFWVLAGCSRPETLETRLDAIAQRAKEQGELNGNVLITRGDRVLYEHSFGPADALTEADNRPETRFAIASISKPFTAVLVMQQVQAGKLLPESPLSGIFPNLAGKPAGAVTIHQLLTHTSGIKELISRDPMKRMTALDLETAVMEPGARFEYSNTGFVCLALVIEKQTGESYETALQRGIFIPAGMNDSGVLRTGRQVAGLARGHRGVIGLVPVDADFAPEAVDGAGSIYSTARDLWRFDRALESGRILSPEMQALMYRQHVPGRYGYGWFLSEQGGRYYPWHSGDMSGYSASLVRQIQRDETIIILGNTGSTEAHALQKEFLQLLEAQP